MKMKLMLVTPLLALLLGQARAGLDVSVSAEIYLGKVRPPPPPEVVVIEDAGPKGPPPWAPAHGFRRNRAYYYYPGANVYYRPADRVWFYLDGRDWRFGVSLPTTFRVEFDRCVTLTMETDQPYRYHEKVVDYYPSNYFSARVRIKEREVNPERGHSDRTHGPDDAPAKGKAKGKGKDKGK